MLFLTAIRPATNGKALKLRAESTFGIGFEWRETSYLADSYLRGPPFRRPGPLKRLLTQLSPPAQLPFVSLKMYRNETALDPEPVHHGFPTDHWVLEFSDLRDFELIERFLADEGAVIVEQP